MVINLTFPMFFSGTVPLGKKPLFNFDSWFSILLSFEILDKSTLKWWHWCEYQYIPPGNWQFAQSALRKSLKSLRGVRTEFTDVNLLKLTFSVRIHTELKLPSSFVLQTFPFFFLGWQKRERERFYKISQFSELFLTSALQCTAVSHHIGNWSIGQW